jgi:mRNA interferase MazF
VLWLREPGCKARPACILTRDEAIPVLSRILIVPATTTRRGLPTEVDLEKTDGLPKACVLTFDNLETVPQRWLGNPITHLSPARMQEVCEALRFAIVC